MKTLGISEAYHLGDFVLQIDNKGSLVVTLANTANIHILPITQNKVVIAQNSGVNSSKHFKPKANLT